MELPFKFEIPKLSHLHFLQVLAPFVPGIVVVMCLAYGDQPAARQIWDVGLGYKTKVALGLAMTGVIGLAVTSVTQAANNFVMRLIARPRPAAPWANSYWRRVAAAYLGSPLSPGSASFSSSEDLDLLIKFVGGLSNKDVEQLGIGKLRQKFQTLERYLEQAAQKANDSTSEQRPGAAVSSEAGRKAVAEATIAFQSQKQVIEGAEERLRAVGVEFEWISLYQALQFLQFPNLSNPYGGLSLLTASLQAAGLAVLWFMIQFGWRSLAGSLFIVMVVVSATYALWLDFKMSAFFRNLDSAELAGMIQEIKQRSQSKTATDGAASS